MIEKVYAPYDGAVKAYLKPFHARNDAEAMRIFGDAVRSGQSLLGDHPGDFQLFYLGEFDQTTGQYESVTPVLLAPAMRFVEPMGVTGVDPADPEVVKLRDGLKGVREEQEKLA